MPKVTCARIMASLIVGALLAGFGSSFIISQAQTDEPINILLVVIGSGLTLLGTVFLLKPCIDTHCQRDIDDHGPHCKCAQSRKKRKGNAALAGSKGCRSSSSSCDGGAGGSTGQRSGKGVDGKSRTVTDKSKTSTPNEDNAINTKLDMVALSSKFGLRTRLETLPEEDSNLELSESTTPQDEGNDREIREGEPPDKFSPTMV